MLASLSKSEWDHWCNEFGESHQTKIGFCRDNNLNYHQYFTSEDQYSGLKKFNTHIGLWIQGGKPNHVNRNLKEAQATIIGGVSLLIRRNYPNMVMPSDEDLSYKLIDQALSESICFEKFIENLGMLGIEFRCMTSPKPRSPFSFATTL